MIPQLGPFGPNGPGLQVNTSVTPDRADTTGRGERAEPLTSGRTETARPTLPPEAADRAREATQRPRPDLIAPDPDAPAGPKPAFEASILDRAREAAFNAPAPEYPPVETEDSALGKPAGVTGDPVSALLGAARTPDAGRVSTDGPKDAAQEAGPTFTTARRDPYAAPPTASERAEQTVATLRRIETPYDTATVDVAR